MSRRTFTILGAVVLLLVGSSVRADVTKQAAEDLHRARDHAAADEHGPAIEAYRAAFAASAELADQHAHELGHQLTWADRSGEAVRWYRRRLQIDPHDLEARLGLARALNWSGRHGLAEVEYAGILRDHPGHFEARDGLAKARRWKSEAAPRVSAVTRYSSDSDDIDILTTGLRWDWQPNDSYELVATGERHLLQQDGQPDVTGFTASAGGRVRLSPKAAWNLHLRVHGFRSDAPLVDVASSEDLAFDLFGYDTWLTLFPTRRLRVDLSSDRSYVETPRALGFETAVNRIGASADWSVSTRTTLGALLQGSDYSDGNSRLLESIYLEHRIPAAVVLALRPSFTAFQFEQQLGRGYWNPAEFWNLGASVSAEARDGNASFWWRVTLQGAFEADDQDEYTVGGASAQARFRLAQALAVRVAAGTGGSRLTSSTTGYTRSWTQVSLGLSF